jgi:hypothetical protein
MEIVCATVFKPDLAVNDVCVSAGSGSMEGPLELAEREGQTAESDVAVGTWVTQTLGLGF